IALQLSTVTPLTVALIEHTKRRRRSKGGRTDRHHTRGRYRDKVDCSDTRIGRRRRKRSDTQPYDCSRQLKAVLHCVALAFSPKATCRATPFSSERIQMRLIRQPLTHEHRM